MQLHAPFISLALAALSGALHGQPLVGPVTNAANGHRYYLLNGQVTWSSAEATAAGLGGHLAPIRSSTENDWIMNFLSTNGAANTRIWIGLNDLAVEDSFQWSSGDPLNYSNWEPGQPDNQFGLEDAVCLSMPSGQWNDTQEDFVGFVEGAVIEVIPQPPLMVQIQVTTNAILRWNSVSNLQYQVQYTSLVTAGGWSNLGAATTATGTNSTLVDLAPLDTRRFYRVVRLP